MKARVKATGEIVEIVDIDFDTLFCNNGGHYTLEHLEGIECDPDYWTRLEHQAAIAAMQGILSNHNLYSSVIKMTKVSSVAIDYAQELVEKMKEERK